MIEVDRVAFRDALSRMMVVSRDTSLDSPLMGEVVDNNLVMWYDSFELSIWSIISNVGGELGKFSIPIDKCYRVISSWRLNKVKLRVLEDNSLRITCGRSRLTLPFYEGHVDELELPPEGETIGRLPSTIIDSLHNMLPFLSKLEEREGVLSCANVYTEGDKLNMVGCDNFHAYVQQSPHKLEQDINCLIPRKTVEMLSNLLNKDMLVNMYLLENNYLLLETDAGFTLQLAPFNGQYPDVGAYINNETSPLFTFRYTEMLENMKLLEPLSYGIARLISRDNDVLIAPKGDVYDTDLVLTDTQKLSDNDFMVDLNMKFFRHCIDVFMNEGDIVFYPQ